MTISFEEEATMCSPMTYGDGEASSSIYGLNVRENRRSRDVEARRTGHRLCAIASIGS